MRSLHPMALAAGFFAVLGTAEAAIDIFRLLMQVHGASTSEAGLAAQAVRIATVLFAAATLALVRRCFQACLDKPILSKPVARPSPAPLGAR